MVEEWNDIWEAAPKDKDATRVDVDSFVQIYRDVDDLFEDEEDEEVKETMAVDTDDDIEEEKDFLEEDMDEELSAAFQSVCNDDGLVSKEALKQWDEVQKLLAEGLVGEDEFDDLWDTAVKSPGTEDGLLNVAGFLSFNVALDGLFEFDEDDDDGDDEETEIEAKLDSAPRAMVVEGDNPPSVLFSQLADQTYLVGMEELKLWTELQDMLNEGDLLTSELQDIFDKYAAEDPSGKLTEDTFQKLYDGIDALFEDDGDAENESELTQQAPPEQQSADKVKQDLLDFLNLIDEDDEELLPCGLDATEADQK